MKIILEDYIKQILYLYMQGIDKLKLLYVKEFGMPCVVTCPMSSPCPVCFVQCYIEFQNIDFFSAE